MTIRIRAVSLRDIVDRLDSDNATSIFSEDYPDNHRVALLLNQLDSSPIIYRKEHYMVHHVRMDVHKFSKTWQGMTHKMVAQKVTKPCRYDYRPIMYRPHYELIDRVNTLVGLQLAFFDENSKQLEVREYRDVDHINLTFALPNLRVLSNPSLLTRFLKWFATP